MAIKQESFRRYHEEKKVDSFTIRLNDEERIRFNQVKKILQQDKDSTAIKQLAELGTKVLLDKKTKAVLELVLNNYRKNKRLGVVQFD